MNADIDFMTDRLAVGGDLAYNKERAAAQVADLVGAAITHIIDCREEWSDEDVFARLAPEVRYLHIGVEDGGGELPDAFFRLGVDFATEALAGADTRVLAHCHVGIIRGRRWTSPASWPRASIRSRPSLDRFSLPASSPTRQAPKRRSADATRLVWPSVVTCCDSGRTGDEPTTGCRKEKCRTYGRWVRWRR